MSLVLDSRAAAAQPRAGGAVPQRRWQVVEEQRYGASPGSELASPQTIAVDGAGRLYVADTRPAAVKVFLPDGKLLRTIGRQGAGPGEYRNPWIAARGGAVVVHDPTLSRTSVFDTSGRFVRGWQTFCCHQNEIAIDRAQRVVVPAVVDAAPARSAGAEPGPAYVRYSIVDGSPRDTIRIRGDVSERLWTVERKGTDGKPGQGTTSMVIPFTARQQFAWHPDGGYVSGWSAAPRLYRSANGSDSVPLASLPIASRRIPESMRREQVDGAVAAFAPMVGPAAARAAVRLADVPSVAPAFTRLLVDEEGNVWASQLLGAPPGATMFRVVGPGGADLGEVVVPVVVPEWGGVAFAPGKVYVRTEDADGAPIVVRMRVQR